jgi:TusA-related sulfurtransferase
MTDIEPDTTVDARGAACPGPLMDLIGEMRTRDVGSVVGVVAARPDGVAGAARRPDYHDVGIDAQY